MPPLSAEQTYDELNGEEAKAVLLERVKAMLDTVPDFQKHLTLPRVVMDLEIRLQIYGRRNPHILLKNHMGIKVGDAPEEELEVAKDLEAQDHVSADTGTPVPDTGFDGTGDPPDKVREDHGLPTMMPVRDRTGITQQRPVYPVPPAEGPKLVGGRHYAAYHEIAREGPVSQGYTDYAPGKEPIMPAGSHRDREKPQVGIKQDFRDAHRPGMVQPSEPENTEE